MKPTNKFITAINRFDAWCDTSPIGIAVSVLILAILMLEIIWIGADGEAIFLPAPEYVITEVEE